MCFKDFLKTDIIKKMYIDKKLIEAYENLQNVSQQKIKDLSDELISVKAKMKNLIGNVS